MPVSILSILWQQLRTLSHVYFPSWKITPRSPPNVSTARLSQPSSHTKGTKRVLTKWKLIQLSLFHGDAVSSTRVFRSTSRFLLCFESTGWTTGQSSGILVVYFAFQGPKHKGDFINCQAQGKDPTNTRRESGLHFQMEFLQVCTDTNV